MHYILYVLVLCSFSLFADQILLDDVMTKEDQKATGVSSLTFKQRMQLEKWINDHCVMKNSKQPSPPEPSPQAQPQKDLSVALNIQGGKKIQLSDQSLWEIAPNDVPNASFWVLPIPIKLAPSNDANYPTLLINQNSGISVRARKVEQPSQGPTSHKTTEEILYELLLD